MKKICSLIFSLLLLGSVFAQQKKVTGTVVDANDNSPMPGVTIQIKGTSTGTITDVNGKFEISATSDAILVISFMGMNTEEVAVGDQSVINVKMVPDIAMLDELVVVGYGTQIKSKLTGNIAKVSGEEIKNMPVPSIELAVQGKAAGVFIESVTGKVTSASRVRVRGATSLTGGNEPLYVIDGVPVNNDALNSHGGAINPLATINFNDIESIEILKDAAAAAIYGSRGANGVFLISTKKGKAGETKINMNYQRGFSAPSNKREFMDGTEYVDYMRHAAANSGWSREEIDGYLAQMSGDHAILNDTGGYVGSRANTDWQHEAFQPAAVQKFDLSGSGGTEKLRYYTSLGYDNQEGILLGNGFQRISGRINADSKAKDWLDIGTNLYLAVTDLDQVNADNAFANPLQLVALPPISPVRDTLGRLTHDTVTIYYNALRHKDFTIRKLNEYRSTALGYANLKLYDGLLWRNEIGYDLYTLKENNRYLLESESGEDLNGYAFSKWAQTQNVSAKSMLNYSNKFGDITFSGVVGTEIQYVTIDETFIEGKNFPFDALETLASAGEIMGGNQELDNYSFLSYLSRVTLDYQDKYLFSVSARVDGSSRFGINNRYGFFPAASIGWVATKEEFLKDNDILSFLKPRMSYGATGNAEIGNHKWRGLYGVETYNGNPGLVPNVKANPDLTWENTHSFNVGIDFGLVENRISGEIDFYSKITEDLLFDKQIPSTSGYDVMTENIGAMENKGVEFMLNTNNLVGNFKWNTTINLSYNKNKVTDLGGLDIYDPGSSRYMNVHMVGQPMGVFYGKEYAGVASYDIPGGNLDGSDIHGGDALWYVNGENGTVDGVRLVTSRFSEANSIVLGKPNPDFIYSLTNSFSYKHSGWNFDFSFMFQGVTGNKIHLAGDPFMAGNGRYEDNQLVSQRDSWREPGDVTDVPQARLFETNGQQSRSSRYLEDGAYLKLRNLVFGVELPKSILSKIKVEQMRVYVMAQNVLTFTKYTGWDPEVSSDFVVDNLRSGIDFYSAPQARSITFGLSLGF